MANTDVIHVLVIDVIFARFIVLRLTKTAKRSFYGPTDTYLRETRSGKGKLKYF